MISTSYFLGINSLDELQKYMTKEQYERYQPFISISIDGVKYLSKSNLLKNFKNSKCCI